MVYRKPPPTLATYISGASQLEAINFELTNRDLQLLRKKLEKAHILMKLYADRKRPPHPFKVGDFAFVKLRPYRQTSIGGHHGQKLSKKFYEPYQLLKQIGKVAFELQLPPERKIHPVFHVSQLKPCHDPSVAPLSLTPESVDNCPKIQSLVILDIKHMDNPSQTKALVQQTGLYPEDATWETLQDVLAAHPKVYLEDKVFLEDVGDVMSPSPIQHGEEPEAEVDDEAQVDITIPMPSTRAKRNRMKPKWMRDFELP